VRRVVSLLASLAATLIAGCGSAGGPPTATLMLDFTPNAIHVGIYAATAHHFDRSSGVRLRVLTPSASTDAVKLLLAGRVRFAILDIHDLAIAREHGGDVVGVMALVQRPLAAVISAPRIGTPRELEGQTVGVTGVPSDTAVLRSIVEGSGGDPNRVRTVTIGFNAVSALVAGRVAAATAFWNDEGVTLRRLRRGFHVFRVDHYGAPSYPELVLCASRSTLTHDPAIVRGVVQALALGYSFALADPRSAAADLEHAVPGLSPALVAAELRAEEPAFRTASGTIGLLDSRTLRRWARWELRFGIVHRLPDVAATFDTRFTGGH
jgi:ABC-type nitrate/sulfonate/bicarbonate transport system substrate-binding protein